MTRGTVLGGRSLLLLAEGDWYDIAGLAVFGFAGKKQRALLRLPDLLPAILVPYRSGQSVICRAGNALWEVDMLGNCRKLLRLPRDTFHEWVSAYGALLAVGVSTYGSDSADEHDIWLCGGEPAIVARNSRFPAFSPEPTRRGGSSE